MNKKDDPAVSETKGLGFKLLGVDASSLQHLSENEKAFIRYIERRAPESLRERMRLCDHTSTTLYHGIIQAMLKLKHEQPKLTFKDRCLISIFQFLITDAGFRKHANQAYERFLVAGTDISAENLKHMSSREAYAALRQAFPQGGYAQYILATIAVSRRARSQQAQRGGTAKTAPAKETIIQQWEKFEGDKTTAATFATKISGGTDDSAKPEYWNDVVTGERLSATPVARKAVARWVNKYRKGK